MDSGIYAAYTGLLARTQALDTAANNLANVGTNGFRAARESFSGVLANGFGTGAISASDGGSQVGETVNNFGVLGGTAADFGQGPIVPTANPLDLALSGEGFFTIKTAQGVRYTRDGSFLKSSTGALTTKQGEPVLDPKGNPILLPTGTISVGPDGTVSVLTDAGAGTVGQLGLVSFADPGSLTAEGTNRFAAAPGSKTLAATAQVEQGSLESSNQDTVHGSMQLILIQRQAEMMQKALTIFDNDFDKSVVEQIARV